MTRRVLGALGVFLAICIWSFGITRYHAGRYDHWVQVLGSVTEVTPQPRSSRHKVVYIYNDGEQLREGSNTYAGRTSELYHAGQGVEVWMNPDDPSQSSLHKPDAGIEPYGPFFLGAPILLAILFGRLRRNPHRHSPWHR